MATVFVSPLWCPHGRTDEHCEDCRLVAALERGYQPVTPPQPVPAPEPMYAEADLFVDHGGERYTYIAEGHVIPHGIAYLPRVPVHRPTHEKPVKGRRAAT